MDIHIFIYYDNDIVVNKYASIIFFILNLIKLEESDASMIFLIKASSEQL